MEAGRQEGILENARVAVLDVLTVRFDRVPPNLSEQINQITDISRLRELLQRAISIDSVDEFEQILEANQNTN
jgi:hypothetical protein